MQFIAIVKNIKEQRHYTFNIELEVGASDLGGSGRDEAAEQCALVLGKNKEDMTTTTLVPADDYPYIIGL